jgi:hypothetical protein
MGSVRQLMELLARVVRSVLWNFHFRREACCFALVILRLFVGLLATQSFGY